MENPATHNNATKVIEQAICEFNKQREEFICGLSLARIIADALENKGLLTQDALEVRPQ